MKDFVTSHIIDQMTHQSAGRRHVRFRVHRREDEGKPGEVGPPRPRRPQGRPALRPRPRRVRGKVILGSKLPQDAVIF